MPSKHDLKPNNKTVSVGFISLGCAKNLVDSQNMAGVLLSENIKLARSPEEADIVIVNTCAFIEEARAESMEMIHSACRLKESGPCIAVLVAGCLPQRYKEDLKRQLPDVDAFIGLDEIENVAVTIRQLAGGRSGLFNVSRISQKLYEPKVPGISFTGGPFAYLKIAEGCNHHCAFCAIPEIRGSYRSRTISQIVKEAEKLLATGIRELNLVSQDVMSYGRDLKYETDLAGLVQALGKIGGNFWIRLLYGHPAMVSDRLLKVMAETPQACHYFDLPIQHGHPDILRAMRRSDTILHVDRFPDRIRQVMPDVALRTTCLLGFPGETEEHFEHLLRYIERVEFDHLGVFMYSPEEKTSAFDMANRPEADVVAARRDDLLIAQRDIVDAMASRLTSTEVEVLLERRQPDSTAWIARGRRSAPEVDGVVLVENVPAESKPGDFIRVRYTGQSDYDMTATTI